MELLIDTHTHTVVSGHAFSTLCENLAAASRKGLEGIVMTEHAKSVPGAQPNMITSIGKELDEEYYGVRLYKGSELNITDYEGATDMSERRLNMLEFAIVSLHSVVIEPGTIEQNTAALLAAYSSPHVDIIGHPGNPTFPADYEALVKAARDMGKLLEINNHSFYVRTGSRENCLNIAKLCKKYDVRICVGSDAHFCEKVGSFEKARELLADADFPEELIVSRSRRAFDGYLGERKKRLMEYSAGTACV